MATFHNGVTLSSSTTAVLRRIAREHRCPGESIGEALRRLTKVTTPAVHSRTGEVVLSVREGYALTQWGAIHRLWSDGWPYITGWYQLRVKDGHAPKLSAIPGAAYGAGLYW